MDINEWYRLNKKRISTLVLPSQYDEKELLEELVIHSYNMFRDINYSVTNIELIPTMNLTDDELNQWYDYLIQVSKENILLKREQIYNNKTKRKSIIGRY